MRGFVFGVFSCGFEFFCRIANSVEGGQRVRSVRLGWYNREREGEKVEVCGNEVQSFEVTINYLVSSKQTRNFGGDLGIILGPALSGL